MDKAAVVILNWNGEAMLRKFLPSVLQHTEAPVYVADNGSSDGSLTMLQQLFPAVRTIALDSNYGFAEGYNRALQQVEAEYVVLLNSDVEVTSGWLATLINFMDSNPEAAACQPKILSYHRPTHFEYAGACGGYIDKYGYPFCRGRLLDCVEKDHGQYDTTAEIHWATGACLCIRSTDYTAAGGLDPRFFAHNEEIDLCWRLRIQGRKIFCVPQSIVYHVGGGTLPQGNPRKTYLNFRNNLTMLYKNLPDSQLRHVLRTRRLLDLLAALQALLKGNTHDARAIIRARRDFRSLLPHYRPIRQQIQAQRQNTPDTPDTLYPHSILWQRYFLRRTSVRL